MMLPSVSQNSVLRAIRRKGRSRVMNCRAIEGRKEGAEQEVSDHRVYFVVEQCQILSGEGFSVKECNSTERQEQVLLECCTGEDAETKPGKQMSANEIESVHLSLFFLCCNYARFLAAVLLNNNNI